MEILWSVTGLNTATICHSKDKDLQKQHETDSGQCCPQHHKKRPA